MLRNELLGYWPREEDVVACIKTDAEASDKAVLLAVHQPMRFERQVIGGELGTVDTCDEHELLRKFLSTNLPDGRVIAFIVREFRHRKIARDSMVGRSDSTSAWQRSARHHTNSKGHESQRDYRHSS